MTSLPHLQAIFEKLKLGYHISRADGELHAALINENDFERYYEYFAPLGAKLVRDERDFFYFEPDDDDFASERLAKVAAFAYVLIDHTANQGLAVEQTLMTTEYSLRGLPHFKLDSYRLRMTQVGVYELEDLKRIVDYLKNIGWAKWIGTEEILLLRPFHRVFSKCVELSQLSADRVDESAHISSVGEVPGSAEEDHDA